MSPRRRVKGRTSWGIVPVDGEVSVAAVGVDILSPLAEPAASGTTDGVADPADPAGDTDQDG